MNNHQDAVAFIRSVADRLRGDYKASEYGWVLLPNVPDAWIDEDKTKKGYEIPFNHHFYRYIPMRSLEEIDADLKQIGGEIQVKLQKVIG